MIAEILYEHVSEVYGIQLNKEKLLWGSIAPDITPFYKFIRHYKDESINYIAKEIVNLIFLSQGKDFEENNDAMLNKYMSKKLGVISHYLCDYTCYPHAERITCVSSKKAKEHLGYEMILNEYAKNHEFKTVDLNTEDLIINQRRTVIMIKDVKKFINEVVEEYEKREVDFENDLDFALTLNLKIFDYIFESVTENSAVYNLQTV